MGTRKQEQNQGGTAKNNSTNSEIFVGRAGSPNLDIEINRDVVSSKHLKIMKIGTVVVVEDLGSTNGTKIDGIPLRVGNPKPIDFNSQILLADTELLDLNHPLIQPLFSDVTPPNRSGGTVKPNRNSGTVKPKNGYSAENSHSSSSNESRSNVRFDKFYPPGYELEEEKFCIGENQNIVIRIFSKDSRLRAIIFGEDSQNLIFNEEKTFESEMNAIEASDRRRFLKQEIQNFLHLHKERYCREEIWNHVWTSDGKHKNGGSYKIVSERFENRLRSKVYINSKLYKDEEEMLEFDNDELILLRAQEIHEELSAHYKEEEKELEFPVSVGWLDAIIKKFPQYSRKPIYAFYWFLLTVIVLFLGVTYITGGFTPKITDKNVDKKWIKHPYYAYIEEPIWGRLTADCLAGSEDKWLKADGKKKDNQFKKQCMNYCHRKVGIINKQTCKELFPNKNFDGLPVVIPKKEYQIISPSSNIGSSTTDGTFLFINNTNSDIDIELKSITVTIDGQPQSGIIIPNNGKTKFLLYAREQGYRYDILFEPSAIDESKKGEFPCKIHFKVKVKGKEPVDEIKNFILEI